MNEISGQDLLKRYLLYQSSRNLKQYSYGDSSDSTVSDTAYMLMYRKSLLSYIICRLMHEVDTNNELLPLDTEVPDNLRNEIAHLNAERARKEEEIKEELEAIKLRIFYAGFEQVLSVAKKESFGSLLVSKFFFTETYFNKMKAAAGFGIHVSSHTQLRFRYYSPSYGIAQAPVQGETEEAIESFNLGLNCVCYPNSSYLYIQPLLLEVREENASFSVYNSEDISIILVIDNGTSDGYFTTTSVTVSKNVQVVDIQVRHE